MSQFDSHDLLSQVALPLLANTNTGPTNTKNQNVFIGTGLHSRPRTSRRVAVQPPNCKRIASDLHGRMAILGQVDSVISSN